jgi:4-phytase/acid phosphatase
VKNSLLAAATLAAIAAVQPARAADALRLKYVVIVTRHGVRSPTWDTARLNAYSAEPWPAWPVPPGEITAHGRDLMKLMGAYYREWLSAEGILSSGCADAQRIHIRADKDQRTVETGRALAESLAPGCRIPVEAQPAGSPDPLFSGAGAPDAGRSLKAVEERLGPDPDRLLDQHRVAFDALYSILNGTPPAHAPETGEKTGVAINAKSVELRGPLANASTFSEDLFLEYAEGMTGKALGWGRLTPDILACVMELHSAYAEIMRRTPYLARSRGSNLLAHVLRSMEQAASGKPAPGAIGHPDDILLVLSGHDTNLSNLSGMLALSWRLPGYQPDDTPPGGALIFSLWRGASGALSMKLRYVAQTLDQMRKATPLTLAAPPASQDLPVPGCSASSAREGCSWGLADAAIRKAIDPQFTSLGATAQPAR